MVLERIVAHKRAEVASRMSDGKIIPDAKPSRRSLWAALGRSHRGFILECKKASPSRGLIREDFDPAKIADAYAPYADAISVLTDERFFSGRLEFLSHVRGRLKAPVLCKDFFVHPFQVTEARSHGADAVLLMMSVLDDDTYRACFAEAQRLSVDVLTEVHDEKELHRALKLKANIIGINNRNLKTLEIDLRTTERLAPLIPENKIVVCESGILTHGDVVRLGHLADAFLVGSSLMGREDVKAACRELIFGAVKVCGLTSARDARAAVEAGALYGGLIFAESSPRRVDAETASKIREVDGLRYVGVFANEDPTKVASLANALNLTAVQLHGEENNEYTENLRAIMGNNREIWAARRVKDQLPNLTDPNADRVLLDTFSKESRGGTGRRFDWSMLRGVDLSRVVLGGGLSPDNIALASGFNAGILDVNSGVEKAPGIKCENKLNELFVSLRGKSKEVR